MALVTKNFSDIITFTRASTGTFFNSAGVLTSAAIDAPRLDYNPSTLAAQGLLIEEARTNSIRNNTMVGAVAPSTFPTNWQSVLVAGLTSTVVGTGTLNGITYLDVRVNGTASVSTYYNLVPDILVAGASGQTWAGSFWAALVGGSLSNTNANIEIRESDAAQGFLTNTLTLLPITSSLTRYSQARTLNNASTAFVSVRFVWQVTAGQPVDFTLRIGLPQLELGAFATSVIPTTTTALTRAADLASVNTLSPWYNASAGTLYAESLTNNTVPASSFPQQAGFSDGTINNRTIIFTFNSLGTNRVNATGTVGGVQQYTLDSASTNVSSGSVAKAAFGYATNDIAFSTNSSAVLTDTVATIPTVTTLYIGNANLGGNFYNGYLRRITYYPRRLSNAELQAITA
jgi:hypothetical protein